MTNVPPFLDPPQEAIPIAAITEETWPAWAESAPPRHRAWTEAAGFQPKRGRAALLPAPDGRIEHVLAGAVNTRGRWAFAGLPGQLPRGTYRFEGLADETSATRAALAWALGCYRFARYRKTETPEARLVWPDGADRAHVMAAAEAIYLTRDLVNTPANDMGPAELAEAARAMAERFGASFTVTEGEALQQGYPAVHAVGMGSPRGPRMIEFMWGDPTHPKVTLVGKGVCFDTGGLDIKPSDGMLIMKKDMGGAAHTLGLALMIMSLNLKLRLRVLIPAVENSISGEAMRPLDVIRTRAGLTVEIGNTDAEGRLVLADALTAAAEDSPALILDFATLTGAARVALGPDVPPFFSNDHRLAKALMRASRQERDPVWHMPLFRPYAADLDGKTADLNNIAGNSFAGAIYAALFLDRFVPKTIPWAHFDVYAWNAKPRPGRPEGGEALGLHACLKLLRSIADR